jgi:hypothetical protein
LWPFFLWRATALVDGASYANEQFAEQNHTSVDAEINRPLLQKQKQMNFIFQTIIEAQQAPDTEEEVDGRQGKQGRQGKHRLQPLLEQ